MSDPATVSVAIATYNGAKHLPAQLDSICQQTFRDFEIVVSDDASSDNTGEILEAYSRKVNLRFAINHRRLGFARNFEAAILACKGEYIALCDQDDVWKEQRLETLLPKLGQAILSYGAAEQKFDYDGEIRPARHDPHFLDFLSRCGSGRPVRRLIAMNWVVSHTILFRSELLKCAFPIPSNQRFHDHWIALVAATMPGGIKYVPEQNMIYRINKGSVTWRPKNAQFPRWWGREALAIWQKRNASECCRLSDICEWSKFTPEDRQFARALREFYGETNPARRLFAALRHASLMTFQPGIRAQLRFAAREFLYACFGLMRREDAHQCSMSA